MTMLALWDVASKSGFGSASEYFLDLIRRDCQGREATRRLDELLHKGAASGEPVEMTEEWWRKTKADLASRLEERRPDRAADDADARG